MQKRVFISYRREDTAAAAGRVYDRLCRLLGQKNVFFDVSAIHGGEDFVTRITSAIENSDAVLMFIGPKWLEASRESGGPRLFEPGDYVRAEVRAALSRSILVLPVRVDGVPMPKPELLPEDIRAIVTRNALPLQHETFDDDTENIIATILGTSPKQRPWDERGKLAVKIGFAVGGSALALFVLTLFAFIHKLLLGRPLSDSISDLATTLLLIGGAILGGWAGFAYEAHRRKRRIQTKS
ncbi:MAG: toll/interleukin-1 receptor domain-containing protein [Methylovirgula sp.]|jgi:hypothetical protein